MADSLIINVPHTEGTAAWLQKRDLLNRGRQIAAAFGPEPVVGFGAITDVPPIGNKPAKTGFHFLYKNLDQALTEFPAVGRRLRFPPGTELIHIGPVSEPDSVRTMATW